MNKSIEEMSYKEFVEYCNDRACDGRWSKTMALNCIEAVSLINEIKVYRLGFLSRKKTEQAREDAWRKFISEIEKRARIQQAQGVK